VGDTNCLETAEFLIQRYCEISKIRDEAERIRQFVKIDGLLKAYWKQEIESRQGSHLKLMFTRKFVSRAGIKMYERHEMRPVSASEGDLIEFTRELKRALAYPALSSTGTREGL
jgi:hypothetical protein